MSLRNRAHHSRRLLQLLADNHERNTGLKNELRADGATIYLYGVIDSYFGISDLAFAEALSAVRNESRILLRINSPGGDVFQGRAIASLMASFGDRIDVQVDGLAASAATTVALAGRSLTMSRGSMWMIHNAWTLAYGNKYDLDATRALLDKVDGQVADDYARATGKSLEEVQKLMDAETWMTDKEAVDYGFAEAVVEMPEDDGAIEDRLAWNLRAYEKAPAALLARFNNRHPNQPPATPPLAAHQLRDCASRTLRLRTLGTP